MEYRFCYTWWEKVCYMKKLLGEELKKTKSFWIFGGFCILLLISTWYEQTFGMNTIISKLMKDVKSIIIGVILGYILMKAYIWAVATPLLGILREEQKVGVCHGYLWLQKFAVKKWYPCQRIQTISVIGPLIWLEVEIITGKNLYLAIPIHVFSSKEEQEEFLEYVEQQRHVLAETDFIWKEVVLPEEWGISFEMDESLYVTMLAQTESINKWSFYTQKERMIPYATCFGVVLLAMLWSTEKSINLIFFPVLLMGSYFIMQRRLEKNGIREKKIRRTIRKSGECNEVVGRWKIRGTELGIYFQMPSGMGLIDWEGLKALIETDKLFLILAKNGLLGVGFEKECVGDSEQWQKLIEVCRAHGIEHRYVMQELIIGKKQKSDTKWAACILGATVLFMLFALYGRDMIGDAIDKKLGLIVYEETYVFHPEAYEAYQPVENQAEVLQSLGFEISKETIESLQEQMEQWAESRVWIEGYAYTALINELAYPQYEEETWEIIAYSNQAYWFDWEGHDISTDYIEILNGVQALSGGDFTISSVTTNTDKVDWEKGSGTVQISFLMNGKPNEYWAKVESDWLDPDFIGYVGQKLKDEKVSGGLYSMSDDGQGLILFYRQKEWVDDFQEKTGKELKEEVN